MIVRVRSSNQKAVFLGYDVLIGCFSVRVQEFYDFKSKDRTLLVF
jgi:hypothetical protein